MTQEPEYPTSRLGRRRSWFGAKRHVKRFLAMRLPHAALRGVVGLAPGLRRSGRLPAPARLREVEGIVDGRRFVMLRPDRCVVAKELYWGRGRRPRPEDDLAVRVFATLAAPAEVVLDVGAYTGLFTLVSTAANRELTVHAFEIVPEVYRALFDNCVRNDVIERVTLHLTGVGEDGARMVVPAASPGSALPDFYSSRLTFGSGVGVRFTSLDSVARTVAAGSRVAVKIDVEGTEGSVFRHGQAFLESFRPDVLCEVLHGVADGAELEALLSPHGYRFFLIRQRDLLPSDRIRPSERFRDWLFTTLDAKALAATGIPVARSG